MKQVLSNFPKIAVVCAFALAYDLPAHAHGYKNGTIEVRHPWTLASTGANLNTTAVVSMKLKNVSKTAECLVSATSSIAQTVSLVVPNADANAPPSDTSKAAPPPVCLKAGQTVELGTAGAHVLLNGISARLQPFDRFSMVLVFEKSGPLNIEVMIEEVQSP